MFTDNLKNISMNGRMAYSILCVEKYLLSKYPGRDWRMLSTKMWDVTNTPWDDWSERFMEVIPQYLFEFDNYEDSDFEFLSMEEYQQFKNLYSGITDGLCEDATDPVNFILMGLYRLEEVYAYTSIPGIGEESLRIVNQIVSTVQNEGVEIPDIDIVAFSSFEQKSGWGDFFDDKHLSLIL